MDDTSNDEVLNLLQNHLLLSGLQAISPILISVCLFLAYTKIKQLAKIGIHPSLIHVSNGLLYFALSFILPLLLAPILVFAGGDAFENYIGLTLSAASLFLVFIGTFFVIKAISAKN